MVRVAVYSDQPILAKGLESLIASDPLLKLSAYCSQAAALTEHLAKEKPDLAVLDLTPEITSAALGALQDRAPQSKLILWTHSVAGEFALQALTKGVRGILRKTLSLEAHLQCLHRVHAGGLWFEKSLTESLRTPRRISLTQRESQLVTMLVRGLKNKEISCELGITEGTVKVYLSHLFQKSGAKGRLELALQGMHNLHMAGASTGRKEGLHCLVMDSLRR